MVWPYPCRTLFSEFISYSTRQVTLYVYNCGKRDKGLEVENDDGNDDRNMV